MSMNESINKKALLCFLVFVSLLAEAAPKLGQPVSGAVVQSWDINVFPDGRGLPNGSGDVTTGEKLFEQLCAACHGPGGIGYTADALAGAEEPLDSEWADKTIGSYWPFATTLFDFIRRAKPMDKPGTLKNDEVYSLSAYLLYLNGIIEADEVINAATLAAIKMPNRDGFIWIDASQR